MAQFFINRPIFAWVISLLILLGGTLAVQNLPIMAYPDISPPQVTINATYPGASAKVIEDTVTSVIEEEMNGIEGLRYIKSESSRTGTSTIILTFATGTDTDIAGVEVQNRLKRVEARLPSSVRTQGVNIDKTRPDFLMVVSLYSPNGSHDATDLGDYIDRAILGEMRRIDGIGSAQLFSATYAMRIWVDPKKMASFAITADEIAQAIRNQNAQLATGELGSLPAPDKQQINATILVPSRLNTPEQFGDIILRSSSEGAIVRLKDVAMVERGANSYTAQAFLNGQESAAFALKLSNTGNALEAAEAVKAKMAELEQYFPDDMSWVVPYDTSIFIDESIGQVLQTLIEAVFLVTLVMFLFLQSWRTTIIPLIVVPVSLIGTGMGLYLLGYSINMLTMFAMVLAIGIVVDDAIIVVENIKRIIDQEKLGPYQATKKAMKQISGAIIGTTAVLIAVFIPMAFFSGSVGRIYQQFSLTIVLSVSISAFLSLSLSPAIAQGFLKTETKEKKEWAFFRWFNQGFNWFTETYMSQEEKLFNKRGQLITMAIFVVICGLVGWRFASMPTGFVPSEDQGFIVSSSLMPSGSTRSRTLELTQKTDAWFLEQPEVERIITVAGFSFFGTGQNTSITFVNLKSWAEREGMRNADQFAAAATAEFMKYSEGSTFAFNMPPIPGLGNSSGFDFQLLDKSGVGTDQLMGAAFQLVGMASQSGKFAEIRPDTLPPAPLLTIEVDRIKARSLGVDIGELNSTLQIALGSAYINDYVEGQKVRQVWLQSDAETRSTPDEILTMQVRNDQGDLVNLSEVAKAQWTEAPAKLTRYNGSPSLPITGSGSPGVSSGEVLALMEEFAQTLPKGLGYEWSGQSLEEKVAGNQTTLLFSLSFLVIFLVLAALYESWSVPLSVILVAPLGILGSIIAAFIGGLPNDIYFKVGLITIIGLSAKNAILIVEFAREAEGEGKSPLEAVTEACRLRLRPILMTSLAFVMGVLPLVLATGAGSASRQAIGTSVVGGMISAAILAIIFVPVFYLLVRKIFPRKLKHYEMAARGMEINDD
ncbi:multidrug efflux RND transporter permease subunit [Kangiella koreensis]|uniref:Efflux pump membrane transporter n=1 Tax=Kangiella koreensis (strain DSM 16069 / JCM 12317 / KCTC 12182 / SW-125) TaxID=523791 RepID=C7R8B5_KANKD|nr:multidrug efflux RND transporter permease subunit [Kangiella koreensis]ACV27680.1 transporter, hydrophobe/amphiphile efflux-1 (HAE1) family [Kangiella koreensis DSM 16069]